VIGQLGRPEYRQHYSGGPRIWLYEHDLSVLILIGDFQFDSRVREEFVDLLRSRNLPAEPSRLIAEPALTVEALLRQMAETDVVISARDHNLILAMILEPVMALSDHAKLVSLDPQSGYLFVGCRRLLELEKT